METQNQNQNAEQPDQSSPSPLGEGDTRGEVSQEQTLCFLAKDDYSGAEATLYIQLALNGDQINGKFSCTGADYDCYENIQLTGSRKGGTLHLLTTSVAENKPEESKWILKTDKLVLVSSSNYIVTSTYNKTNCK